jgi:hypothetical protein
MMGGNCGKRTTVRFLNSFNDIVLNPRPSVPKVTINQVCFDRFYTQKGFELL